MPRIIASASAELAVQRAQRLGAAERARSVSTEAAFEGLLAPVGVEESGEHEC
jgi:hypothetical protein